MKHWIWVADVWVYAWLREWMGGKGIAFAAYAGNLFFWTPFFAGGFTHMAIKSGTGIFRKSFFLFAAGLIAFQVCSLAAYFISSPSPLFWEHHIMGTGVSIPLDLAYSAPDWPCGAFMALLSFILIRGKIKRPLILLIVLSGMVYFTIQRIGGSFTFLSGALLGLCFGLLLGWIFAKLSQRVENIV